MFGRNITAGGGVMHFNTLKFVVFLSSLGCSRQEDPTHRAFLKFSISLFKLYLVDNR